MAIVDRSVPGLFPHPPGVDLRTGKSAGVFPTIRQAVFGDKRKHGIPLHRYALTITWKHAGNWCNFLMLNPSTADEMANDPTVERCERRAREWGFDGITITNLFAFRATQPADMKRAADPVGKHNNHYIIEVAKRHNLVVCAWGHGGEHMRRAMDVVRLLQEHKIELTALKCSDNGTPHHPLYLPYDLKPKKFPMD